MDLPVTLATTVFLGLLRVGIDVARLGEVTRKVLLGQSGAVGKAGMITIVLL